VSFHPCVRLKRWENEKVMSFVPPDGPFKLCSYHVGSSGGMVSVPLYIKHNIRYAGSAGRFEVSVGPRHTSGKVVENVKVTSKMPKQIVNVNLTPSQGEYSFNSSTHELTWDIGRIQVGKPPSIRGSISLQPGVPLPEEKPTLSIQFKIQQLAISGLRISRLDMYNEKYKPFKGVKYMTLAGKFQVRT